MSSEDDKSGYRFYSIAIVTEDKPRKSAKIKANLTEKSSMSNGDMTKTTQSDVSIPDANGVARKASGGSKRTIEATWLPFSDSNRLTPPDVVNGETVMIWKVADVEEYYWSTMLSEPEIRRLEHVIYGYCNIPSGRAAMTPDTSYWIKWSTLEKLVHIHTSDNDGEACQFDIMLDTRNGQMIFRDNFGNQFMLDSPSSTFQLESNTDFTVKTGSSVKVETQSASIKANQVTVDAPNSTFTGNVAIGGSLSVAGGITMGGGAARMARSGGSRMVIYGDIQQVVGGLHSAGAISSAVSMTAPQGNFSNIPY